MKSLDRVAALPRSLRPVVAPTASAQAADHLLSGTIASRPARSSAA